MKFANGTKIIAGFPGVGKSFFTNSGDYACKDSDSSEFSWLEHGVRNPNFVSDYISHIEDTFNSGKYDYIFISTHVDIYENLPEHLANHTYMLVPAKELKAVYMERYENRGSPESFIKHISDNWESYIDGVVQNENCAGCLTLSEPYETVADAVRYIEENKI